MHRVGALRGLSRAAARVDRPVPDAPLTARIDAPDPLLAAALGAALSAGVRAFIQPGGSIRDEAVVKAVDSAEGTMVFTGARHFRH